MTIPGFSTHTAAVNGQTITYSKGGDGPPLLLLHGFPQTHAMWAGVAPILARHFTVIAADLRGYGASSKPPGVENYSFRPMAADQVALMAQLGFDRFHLVGHDRGARTAHRLALDNAQAVRTLTLMDIVPTYLLFDQLTTEVAHAYYHWFFLAQAAPLPDAMIGHDPDTYFQSCLTGWDTQPLTAYDPAQLDQYRAAWRDPDCIRAMCDDYRAALAIDVDLDAQDLDRRVTCPALVLYGAEGVMDRAFGVAGTWADRLSDMTAQAMPGGHFFPDHHPKDTAQAVLNFLQARGGA